MDAHCDDRDREATEGNAHAAPAAFVDLPSGRYADQTMGWQTRLAGIGGTSLIGLLILGGALFSWNSHQPLREPATLSVFDVAQPAAPPAPPKEMPPGPEQTLKEKEQPLIELPKIEPAEIEMPLAPHARVQAPSPVPDTGPPVKDITAPETQPGPPTPQVWTDKPTWEGLVLGALNKVKRYPRIASFRRQQGVPYIRFVMDREGKVLSVRLERSSGFPVLDDEAIALPKRASPLPKPPNDMTGNTLELVVPVEFFMSTR